MARAIVFVNDSVADWTLSRFGGIVVPAGSDLDVTAVVPDNELIREIQNGLASEFDADHYLRVNGVDLSAAESAGYGSPNQAGGYAILNADATVSDAQHGDRSGDTLHADATAVTPGFMVETDKDKLDGVAPNAARMQIFQFGRNAGVPGGGTLTLYGPGSTIAPLRINRPGEITGASVDVDAIDGTRNYNLTIYKNGASVATLNLPISTLGVYTAALNVAVVAGDKITAAMILAGGLGASTFKEIHALVEVQF